MPSLDLMLTRQEVNVGQMAGCYFLHECVEATEKDQNRINEGLEV